MTALAQNGPPGFEECRLTGGQPTSFTPEAKFGSGDGSVCKVYADHKAQISRSEGKTHQIEFRAQNVDYP